jgi:hypothetical protein
MTKAFTLDTARCTKAAMLSEDVIIRSGNSQDRKQVCSATCWHQSISLWINLSSAGHSDGCSCDEYSRNVSSSSISITGNVGYYIIIITAQTGRFSLIVVSKLLGKKAKNFTLLIPFMRNSKMVGHSNFWAELVATLWITNVYTKFGTFVSFCHALENILFPFRWVWYK